MLTQVQFGEKIGVTNKIVSRWENGNYLPLADVPLATNNDIDIENDRGKNNAENSNM